VSLETDYLVIGAGATAMAFVDTTYVGVTVPSMRPPPYPAAERLRCVAPNELPQLPSHDRYVIVGAGKTAMDTCLWLLRHRVRTSWRGSNRATRGC
jgi:hypothetical protein